MDDSRPYEASLQRTKRNHGQRRTWSARPWSTLIRLATWYCIITVVFRCPSSLDQVSDSSPRICTPYLDLTTRLKPYTIPYYAKYAAPYVQRIQPYAEAVNAKVYVPATDLARSKYNAYGAERLARGYAYAQQEWDLNAMPTLQGLKERIAGIYEQFLATHVDEAYTTISPRVQQAKAASLDQYQTVVIPTYQKAQPYFQQLYTRSQRFTTETGLPYVFWVTETATNFVKRRIWPPIRILYGENILPQLMKIKERLASYRDGKRLENIMQAAQASATPFLDRNHEVHHKSSYFTGGSASASIVTTKPGTASELTAEQASISSSTSSTIPEKNGRKARQVSEDLMIWQSKFAKAADKGAEGLQERVAAIASDQIQNQAKGTGEALLISLEESAKAAVENLKLRIVEIVASIPKKDDVSHDEAVQSAKAQAKDSVRSAGRTILSAAERLRAWRSTYDTDTESLIDAASESVLEVVDNIRDLGLQEIGMRWASMDDGVSYKDWSEYHAMRKTFAEWRGTVKSVVANHAGVDQAERAGGDIESRGMAVAEDGARELARLKDVALWKIDARDGTDDFRTRYAPPKIAHAADKLKEKIVSSNNPSDEQSQGVMGSIASGASSLVDVPVGNVEIAKDAAASAFPEAGDSLTPSKSSTAAKQFTATLGPNGESETRVSSATEALKSASTSLSKRLNAGSSTETLVRSAEEADLNQEL